MLYSKMKPVVENQFNQPHIKALDLITPDYTKFIDSSISVGKGLDINGDILQRSTHNLNISFKDTITNWTGLFDKPMNFVNCNKSDLIAKRNVKNYIVTRKLYNYRSLGVFFNNAIIIINNNIGLFSGIIKNTYENDSLSILKKVDNTYKKAYETYVDKQIDNYLFGRKKKVLYDKVYALLLGDGIRVIEVKSNFQDIPYDLSTLIEWAYTFTEGKNNGYTHESDRRQIEARVKDLGYQTTEIINNLYNNAKRSRNKDRIALITKYLKITRENNNILLNKIDEFFKADSDAYFEQSESIVKVLTGLYEYKGE